MRSKGMDNRREPGYQFAILSKLSALACAALLMLGCGNPMAKVTGMVTLDGAPLAGGGDIRGTVTFTRADGSGVPAVGILDSAGYYDLATANRQGIPPGNYTVAIAATKIIIPEPGATPSGRPITPRHYARANESGLTAEVQPGKNTIDFSLVSRERG